MCIYLYICCEQSAIKDYTCVCLCRLAVAVLAATSLTVSVHSILLVWARKTSSYIRNPLQDQKYHCLNLITAYQETCYWNLLSLQLSGFGSDIWILFFFTFSKLKSPFTFLWEWMKLRGNEVIQETLCCASVVSDSLQPYGL